MCCTGGWALQPANPLITTPRWSKEQGTSDSGWAARLEDAHNRWLRERGQLERAAAERLAAVQEAAAARYDSLRASLESRVAAITEKLAALAAKEGKKDRACKELKQEVMNWACFVSSHI
jgi:chorismate mutase